MSPVRFRIPVCRFRVSDATLDQSKSELSKTKKQVQTGQKDISYLGNQIKDRVEHIHRLEGEMDRLDSQIVDMQGNIVVINRKLSEKKAKLKSAIRYACSYRQKTTPLLFVLSANTLTQMYRRARYAREYVSYERNLGRQVQQKQSQLLDAMRVPVPFAWSIRRPKISMAAA